MTLFRLFFDAKGYLKLSNFRNLKTQRLASFRPTARRWNFLKRSTQSGAEEEKVTFFEKQKQTSYPFLPEQYFIFEISFWFFYQSKIYYCLSSVQNLKSIAQEKNTFWTHWMLKKGQNNRKWHFFGCFLMQKGI